MGEIEERCAGGVFGTIPERGGERWAGIADPSVGVEDQDDVGKTLDQATIVALCEAFERVVALPDHALVSRGRDLQRMRAPGRDAESVRPGGRMVNRR
jgi:hypothetical protein